MRTIFNNHPNLKYDSLIKEPKTIIITTFDEKGFKQLDEDLNEAHKIGQSIIPIVIDSYGGDAYSVLGMASMLLNSNIPIATILMSKAMSCGAILFTCGSEGQRYMSKLATIMIHDVSSYNNGKVEEIKSDAKETERLNNIVYEMMEKNCQIKKGVLKSLVHEKGHADWFLDAQESLKLNITNHIGVPTFTVTSKIDFDLSIN